jgi:hypothetical protein
MSEKINAYRSIGDWEKYRVEIEKSYEYIYDKNILAKYYRDLDFYYTEKGLYDVSNALYSFSRFITNKYIVVFGQWFVAAILGNIFGLGIMKRLYRNILPKAKYSHYDRTSHKSVYMDNVEDYVSHDEVQIGIFADNGKNRKNIEKIYKVTWKIVLIQLLVSIIFFLVLIKNITKDG